MRWLWILVALAACSRRDAAAPSGATPRWEWRHPLPQGNALNAVWAAGDKTLYAVGDAGTILASADGGATWVAQVSGVEEDLTAVVGDRGGGVYVAGKRGVILVATDGKTWVAQRRPTGANLNALYATGHGRLFAAGDAATLLRSTDGGGSWDPLWTDSKEALYGIAGSRQDDLYAVGAGGTILTASKNGPKWERRIPDTEQDLYRVVVGPLGEVVAVGSGGTVVRSVDRGDTWAVVSSGTSETLLAVWGGRGAFYAGGTGGAIITSADGGQSWSPFAGGGETLSAGWAGAESLVVTGNFGSLRQTRDGKIWEERAPGTRRLLLDVAVAGDVVVAVGADGTILRRAGEGKFVAMETPTKVTLTSVWLDGEQGGATGPGVSLVTEDRGATWHERPASKRERLAPPVKVGAGGKIERAGKLEPSGTTHDLRDALAAGDDVWVCGDRGVVLRSTKGGPWIAETPGTTNSLMKLAATTRGVIAVGAGGTILELRLK